MTPNDTAPIVSIRNVSKTYASGFHALKDVSLDIRRGEIFALLGPNGAGKTTTIRMLMDMIHPDSGTARVLGVAPGAGPAPRQGP